MYNVFYLSEEINNNIEEYFPTCKYLKGNTLTKEHIKYIKSCTLGNNVVILNKDADYTKLDLSFNTFIDDKIFLLDKGIVFIPVKYLDSYLNNNYEFLPISKITNTIPDIVCLGYGLPIEETTYLYLKEKYKDRNVIHVNNIKGIHKAHVIASYIVQSSHFYVVDDDADLKETFDFSFIPDNNDTVYVWRAENTANDLIYGYGGVKLFPTQLVRNYKYNRQIDFTMSVGKFQTKQEISNITCIDLTPKAAYKSAFRECAKLASSTQTEETKERLEKWLHSSKGINSKYIRLGAEDGKRFGEENKYNIETLSLINDRDWIYSVYWKKLGHE